MVARIKVILDDVVTVLTAGRNVLATLSGIVGTLVAVSNNPTVVREAGLATLIISSALVAIPEAIVVIKQIESDISPPTTLNK